MPIKAPPKRVCEMYLRGHCPRGNRCHMSHGGDTSANSNATTKALAGGALTSSAGPSNSILVTLLKLVFDVTGTSGSVWRDGGQLNLTAFANLANLSDVKSQIDFNAVFFCNALCQVIKEKANDAVFLVIDDNNIRNLQVFLKALKDVGVIHIQGLSACGNNIANTDFTAALKPFKQLNELRLMGNPVTQNDRYRDSIRKALPELVLLDGDAVQRPPLGLPWPQPPCVNNQDGSKLVQCLAEEFFAVAERRGPDAAISMYHEDAVFTLSVAPGGEMKAPEISTQHPKRQDIMKDFVSLRLAQNDRSRNIVTTRGPVRAVRGRADIGAALRNCLYPRGVIVEHNLISAGITTEFMPSAINTIALITIHSTMTWIHSLDPNPEAGVSRHYERTLAVIPDNNSPIGFYITNDCVHLRAMDAMEPLWSGNAPGRMETMGRKYNVHPGIMETIVPLLKSDRELHDVVTTGLQNMPYEAFQECLNIAPNPNNNQNERDSNAMQIARVASTFNVPPARALDALQRCNFDLSQVRALFQ
jgi:hypothetical protein